MAGDGTDTTIALISLANAKTYLNIVTAYTTHDTILIDLINQVSTLCNSYCGRQLLSKVYIEYYNGNGKDRLYLINFPVSALTYLYIADCNRVFDSTTLVTIADDVLLNKEDGIIQLWNNETIFDESVGNVKVSYTAGWTLATVPYDLQLTVRKWVAYEYKQWQKQEFGIQSESISGRSISNVVLEIPDEVKFILDRYKRLDYGFNDYSHSDVVT